MNERMKCFNLHGHTYLCELRFSFTATQDIGYAIDFKEIKRVGCQWIDDKLDHAFIANPYDDTYINAAIKEGSKLWKMSLNGKHYCNPTVEFIAREIFLAMEILFERYPELDIHEVELFETPNCSTVVNIDSIPDEERYRFCEIREDEIREYANQKGYIEYDDREI